MSDRSAHKSRLGPARACESRVSPVSRGADRGCVPYGLCMDIEWEDPPEHAAMVGSGQHQGKYLEFALAIREFPGKWAVLPTGAGESRTEKGAMATAQNIRRGKVKGFKAGQYDTAVKGTKIWVRYKEGLPPVTNGDSGPPSDVSEPHDDWPEAKVVRAWAIGKGMDVPDRGRLPKKFFEAYEQAVARGEIPHEE